MACGLPIIATRETVAPDLIEDGKSGILIPAADTDAIYRAFCWLYENREAARRMGEAGRRAVAVIRQQNFERRWTGYIENQLSADPSKPAVPG
jgi:starch synthase